MTECAWCASRTKNTYFGEKYKRLAARREKKRAIVALAHDMLKIVYSMLKNKTKYVELGASYVDESRKESQIKYYKEQLNKLLGEDLPETESA